MKRGQDALRAMASAILAELAGVDTTSSAAVQTETVENPAEMLEVNDTFDAVSQLRRYRALRAAGADASESMALAGISEPRTTRRQFLTQRLGRRDAREAAGGEENAAGAETAFDAVDMRQNELTEAAAPSRLSEIYRRDARRYDGPFERY